MTPAEWVTLLAQRGHDLREAGVMRLTAGEFSAELAPADVDDTLPDATEGDEPSDPLDDPMTYGGPMARIPTIRRRR